MTTGDEGMSAQVASRNAMTAGPFRRVVDTFRHWPTSRAAYPIGYVASFDGARGLMTLGVLLAHTRPALFPGAAVYMDVFFVMSGYLITSLLIAEHERRGAIDLRKFYVRPVFVVISEHLQPRYICTFLIGWPITFALAIASYYLIERHFMRARHQDSRVPARQLRKVFGSWVAAFRFARQDPVADREPVTT
jgi:peptidoglycan/LPS O-acetylase OafA/YrhL